MFVDYKQDLKSAARRHLRAAQSLYSNDTAGAQPGCRAVAGYIFGLAGELALKQIMREIGIRERPPEERRSDPYYQHFPMLKSLLAETMNGRVNGQLRELVESPGLFRNWNIAMRYAPTSDIQDVWVESWKQSAEELVGRMDVP